MVQNRRKNIKLVENKTKPLHLKLDRFPKTDLKILKIYLGQVTKKFKR